MTARLGAAILGCAGPVLLPDEAAFFKEYQPFGFILFARNIDTGAALTRLCADLREAVGRDAPILIDQEGGRVQRLRAPLVRDWVPPLDEVARQGPRAGRAMALRSRFIAREMRAFGVDVICAPLIDVAQADTHPVLRNRCYGQDPALVAGMARAVSAGLQAGGVSPVVKHLPGHGRAKIDSHLELPRTDASMAQLEQSDFAAARALAGLPLAMTAHVVYSTLDTRPATQSPVVIDWMRRDLGVSGLLMTDDISMQALSGSVATRSAAARSAGCDIVLHCNGDLSEMEEVADASGDLTGAARLRADLALKARPARDSASETVLWAEWEALLRHTV